MRKITGTVAQLEQRLATRNVKLEAVLPAVLSTNGDQITVDIDHPAYPKPPCSNCGGCGHWRKDCPISGNYDGNYRLDSKGSEGCGCA